MKLYKCFIIYSLLITQFSILTVSAQKVKPDTTNIIFKDEDEFEPIDSIRNEVKYMPGDMIFIPSALLYDHQWENLNIRFRKIDIAGKKDTTLILFNTSPDNNFYFPVKGKLLSPFGYRRRHFHAGVDIKLRHNDSVYSVMSGKVRIARRFRGYGNAVVVRHYNGLETVYAHLNKICVKVNDELNAGDLLGLGGRTGRSTADHLHFETRFLEQPINPMAFIDFDYFKLKSDTLILTANTFNKLASAPNKPSGKLKYKKGKSSSAKNNISKADSPGVKSTPQKDIANENDKNKTSGNKYYKIKPGDTLYNIAKKNNTTVDKLCKINGFSKKKILKIGMKIKVS